MNRRNFLGTLVKAFTILPAATTYHRSWTKLGSLVVPEYRCVMNPVHQDYTLYSTTIFIDIPEELKKQFVTIDLIP